MIKLNWEKAYIHLLEYIAIYAEIGVTGLLGLPITILPLYRRYKAGERTNELYDDIMSVQ